MLAWVDYLSRGQFFRVGYLWVHVSSVPLVTEPPGEAWVVVAVC